MIITKHAFGRAKERCGLNKKALRRILPRALDNGLTHRETKGRVRKYLDFLYLSKKKANNIRIYNSYIFICEGNTLITIYTIPNHLKKLVGRLFETSKK